MGRPSGGRRFPGEPRIGGSVGLRSATDRRPTMRCVALRSAALVAVVAGGVLAASVPAGAATLPGANGKIVYGQVFPNYGVTINPDGSDPHAIGPADSTTCDTLSPGGVTVLCNLWSDTGVQPATANPDGSNFTLLNEQ